MLPHRSDTSRGHLHPPTRPRLTLSPLPLYNSRSVSLPLLLSSGVPSRSRSCTTGVVSPVRCRLCRHFPGGACAGPRSSFSSRPPPRVFATTRTTPSQSLLRLVAPFHDDATAIVYASNLSTSSRGTTPRPIAEERSFTRFLGLPIVAIECFHDSAAMRSRRMSCARETRAMKTKGETRSHSRDLGFSPPPTAIALIPRDFQDSSFRVIRKISERRSLLLSPLSRGTLTP